MSAKPKTRLDWWHSSNQILVMIGVGLSNGLYGPSLIDLAEIYASAPDEVAVMNSTRALGMFFGSFIGSFFFAHMNDQILMMITLLIYGVGTSLIPLLPSITWLYIAGFIAGTSVGVAHIGSQVRLVEIWPEKSASAIQAFHTAYGVGAMIGPFVGAPFLSVRENDLILEETQLQIPYAFCGFLFLLIVASMVVVYCQDPTRIVGEKKASSDENGSVDRNFEIILLVLLFAYLTIDVNGEVTFSTLVSAYAVDSPSLQFSRPDAAYLAGVFWTTFTGGRLVSIFLAIFVDVRQLLIISHLLVIFASGILIAFDSSAFCAWLGVGVMGLGFSSMYGAVSGLVFQYLQIRPYHVSVILTAGCLGIAVPAYFVPSVVEVWPMFLQYFTGVGNIIHLVFLLILFRVLSGRDTIHSKDEQQREPKEEDNLA